MSNTGDNNKIRQKWMTVAFNEAKQADVQLLNSLEQFCKVNGANRSVFVRNAIAEKLAKLNASHEAVAA